ncbi:hypothetical protein Adeh_3870 [Anaeromyxobacter dehalogenans 2CP-C]|uniref:Rifampin ADP-ribosyltransferase domain-containing protein n=1 Tax=Anaeromyxobacter dehalogenans (strain 2CP-C) TaxID=290397 RepID=Q2IGC7_ANADE|nr:hypothetical protein Adeh_3870 [Anaeromyxobacter dehalogenans 2CP-C]
MTRDGQRQAFFHGTRDPLQTGQLIHPRRSFDRGPDAKPQALVLLSRALDDAIWAAELAAGDGPGRVYVVEPTGPVELAVPSMGPGGPGHPWMSCCSREPLRVVGEVTGWPLYHGTRADLRRGDLIEPGRLANFGAAPRTANHVYFTRTLDAATWGAELAAGEGRGRIYLVEPTGPFEDDPNLTNKKFRGNPTKSFRSRSPLRVTGELTTWQGHTPEAVQARKDGLARLQQLGDVVIDD